MGLLYDKSIFVLALFSVMLQIAALPVLFFAGRWLESLKSKIDCK